MSQIETNKLCSVRPDLIEKEELIPVGNTYIKDGQYQYRWLDDEFQILLNNTWLNAYSIDFIFE